ncbi:MAG: hypothetical protein Q7T82_06905 [Armatimonadota bacterium]|nr:hypothetical protein [Armatimonadota bacterium]
MSIVLEPCTLADLHNLDEDDPVYEALARILDTEQCYIIPAHVVQTYRMIKDAVSKNRAEAVLDMMKKPDSPQRIVTDLGLIDLAIEAMEYGVPLTVAFCGALAKSLDADILTNEQVFDPLQEHGFCRIRRY